MRTGIVIAYNRKVKIGVIKDSNEQRIRFYSEDVTNTFQRFDVVQFDIAFIARSLRAVNVVHVLDRQGKPVRMTVGVD
ncbi:hypothetical protein [Pedobacter agri]|uniref:Uncharacterized protein n=1 Tax=Pedobacter agri TaxID=454586 RepID=A0A9X3DGP4_9SPHI|nr:hypothetical protein [Pedobacter agri]MCX3267458.1 hypothetical protein [Pedobacter agri]